VPQAQRGRLLAFGILGAIAFRGSRSVAGVAILQALEQTIYVFGAGLLVVAYRSLVDRRRQKQHCTGRCDACLTRVVPITDGSRESIAAARTRPFVRDAAPARMLAILAAASRSQSTPYRPRSR